jgi:hypothetical protein
MRRERLVFRVAAVSVVAIFTIAAGGLVFAAPDERDPTFVAAGQSGGGSSSQSEAHRPDDAGDGGGGWEEHRSTSTSPDNSRPEIPPGHDKPTTTTTTKPTSTTVAPSTTTTTAPPSLCSTPTGTSAVRPSDLVPQFTVLDVFPAPAYVGPLDPAHPNQRPWDAAIVTHGATRGYARTWTATSGPGGYTVYAFEFPSASSAQAAGADAFASFVEDYGAAPFTFCDGVSSALVVADAARAYWTQGRFLRIVDVSTQSPRDVVPAQAQADMRSIVEALLAL